MRRILVFVAVLIGAGLSRNALAQNSKGYNGNGNVCAPTQSAVSSINRNYYGVYSTASSGSQVVYCPVSENNVVGSTFTIQVYPRNSTTALSCTVYELDSSGNSLASWTQSYTGSPSQGVIPLDYPSVAQSTNMVVLCSIPPVQSGANSGVANFFWGF
jgi:hypothetical protein